MYSINDINDITGLYENELRKLSLDIHNNPELGKEEFKACKWQTELLEKYGFTIERNFCGMETAYHAVFKGDKEGPSIAMLSEYDALPGLGHGCGHNLITMISVGSGLVIKEIVKKYGGEIHVVGTPAEETEGAKVEMARQGVFRDFDVAMMAHPYFKNLSAMNTSAICARRVEFFGKAAHAAASPEEGINALDAVINFFNMVNALRQQLRDDIRIHGIIENGGVAPNIIPDYTSARFYVRAGKMEDVEKVLKRVEGCIKGAAEGTGAEYKISKVEEDFKDTNTNMALCELAYNMYKSLGHEIEWVGSTKIAGSSDLGDVSYQCPAIQMICGTCGDDEQSPCELHTVEFEKQAGSSKALDNGFEFIKAFALTAQELITNPGYIEKIKKEFIENTPKQV